MADEPEERADIDGEEPRGRSAGRSADAGDTGSGDASTTDADVDAGGAAEPDATDPDEADAGAADENGENEAADIDAENASDGDEAAETDDSTGDLPPESPEQDVEDVESDEGDEPADAGSGPDADGISDASTSPDDGESVASESGTEKGTDGSVQREAKTDGEGGVVGDRPERDRSEVDYPDPDEDVGGISTPPDDEEMPLADHIEEMILRLAVVLLIGSAGTAIGLLWASEAIEYIWLNVFPYQVDQVPPPHLYAPLELWMTRIKVAALLGIMVALPMFVYQCYLFMKPGLYPHERKYYLAAVPTSVVLAGVGMLFSFFAVLPVLFRYFTFYSEGSAAIAYALGETFDLILTLTGFLAVVFQIPLFIMLAIMMGVTTRRWLEDKRLYFWAGFAGLSFMFTVDPTMMAPVLVAITMIVLFEGTLLILRWAGQ